MKRYEATKSVQTYYGTGDNWTFEELMVAIHMSMDYDKSRYKLK